MNSTIRLKGWSFLLVTGLVFVLQLVIPAQIWTMLFVGVGMLLLISYAWAKSLQGTFTLVRERRYTMAQVGDRLEERFTISKRGVFPVLWVEIIDRSNMPGYNASLVTGLGVNAKTRWYSNNVCTQRGVFQLGPTEVNFGDPFGLFAVKIDYPNSVDFTIIPPVLALPDIQIASRGHAGEGFPRPYSLAPTEPTATVRRHNPADSLKRIHWPTTARRDKLYVYGLQETTSGDWWLVLDVQEAVQSGLDENATLEKGVLIASSLADRGLRENQAVGLLAHGQEAVWLPPKSVTLQRWQIMSTLAKVQAGSLSLADLLTRSSQLIKQNTSLIVITPSIYPEWIDPLLMLKRGGVVPTIILIYTDETRSTLQVLVKTLAREGVRSYLIDQSSLVVPVADELAGQWKWRTLGTGRAVAIHKPKGYWETL